MTIITSPPDPPDRNELRERWRAILQALQTNGALALSAYDDAVKQASTPVVQMIERVFGATMQWAEVGRRIGSGASELSFLAQKHAGLSDADRALLISNAVDELSSMAQAAEDGDGGRAELLRGIGAQFMALVLSGTAGQFFAADLSTELGISRTMPEMLCTRICDPLVKALASSLGLCAPGTRHAIMEGLGALLRHLPQDTTMQNLPALDRRQCDTEGDQAINDQYDARRKRHTLIVLAIAGDAARRREYLDILATPVGTDYDHRADYLRALPAICRQAPEERRAEEIANAVEWLRAAATEVSGDIDAPTSVQAAFSRYQEIVFQTIDVMLDRGAAAEAFDQVVASAVRAIRPTLVGPLDLCNAQARASIAVLCTAAKIAAELHDSETDACLRTRYEHLGGPWKEWMNPGIIEGCFRGLPLLLRDSEHDRWTRKALDALLDHLVKPVALSDLASTHARLCATASFRELLIAVTVRLRERFFDVHSIEEQETLAKEIEQAIRDLLANPTAARILAIFHKDAKLPHTTDTTAKTFAADVVNAVAFASEVLEASESMFALERWKHESAARQLLLVRILALHLRSASHGRVELARCEALARVLAGLAPVRIDEERRTNMLWHLISFIPSPAAEAADADLQEFVAYRSTHASQEMDKAKDASNVPQYVLAMVSDYVSYRLAAEIARQVDLNRHRARLDNDLDFAEPLYQVMLRGPNPAIFDHLLARVIETRDRELLLLLRDHVMTVQECVKQIAHPPDDKPVIERLATHGKRLIEKMVTYLNASDAHRSRTLRNLVTAMQRFVALAEQKPVLWDVIIGKPRDPVLVKLFETEQTEDGGLDSLFKILDHLAEGAPVRKELAKLCSEECLHLRSKVEHYLSLSVGEFAECSEALRGAIDAVRKISKMLANDAGLQPPEKTILLALLDSWNEMFRRTIECWVDAPRRCVHARRPQTFWLHFVNPSDASRLKVDEPDLALPQGTPPPIPLAQNAAFERFYVDWMASELDIDHLRWALRDRWKTFGVGYRIITRRRRVVVVIALPFILAAILHQFVQTRAFAGVGLLAYVLGIGMLTVAGLAGSRLTRMRKTLVGKLRRLFRKPPIEETTAPYEYRFHAMLPRLFKLIVVPLALLVDFEHSYLFPMHASDGLLLALMMLAVLTTTYFVRREVRARQNDRSRLNEIEVKEGPQERRHVGQIVAIALAHSFAAAVLLSFIFESQTIRRTTAADRALAKISIRDAPTFSHQPEYFLGVLPREVQCDLKRIAVAVGMNAEHAEWLNLRFYPTLILSWTALGLFFGVFLEGFMKGERLRGET